MRQSNSPAVEAGDEAGETVADRMSDVSGDGAVWGLIESEAKCDGASREQTDEQTRSSAQRTTETDAQIGSDWREVNGGMQSEQQSRAERSRPEQSTGWAIQQ